MPARLYAGTFDEVHIPHMYPKQECTLKQLYHFATEYGYSSHYKNFRIFLKFTYATTESIVDRISPTFQDSLPAYKASPASSS